MKVYEMSFMLGAKLSSNFGGTFSQAQKALMDVQKEIVALDRKQSDVSAYSKQQTSIEKTSKQLDSYRERLQNTQQELTRCSERSAQLAEREKYLTDQIKLTEQTRAKLNPDSSAYLKNSRLLEQYSRSLQAVRREINANAKRTADMTSKETELNYKIYDSERALKQKNRQLDSMGRKLEAAGVDVKDLTGESKRLEEEMSNLCEKEKQAADEAEKFGNKGVNAAEAVMSVLESAGIAAALMKIAEAYKNCVSAAKEFGYTMSTVEALSGASAEEMRELTAAAKEMGATTAYTANQSAQAMTYMGMAGWDAQQMMSGMDGVLNLAAASGEDLAMVSDIVTDNLTAFRLTAEDTAHFSDVLAAAATNSNTSVGIMGETFKGSASVAGALGYSIEDVAVGVGLMANAGVKGSIANTALKNTFNGLLSGVTLTGKAFGEAEYTAVNADGTMKSFGDTIQELRGYFEQMTESERVNNAMALAGQRGYNGLLAILNATDEDYQELSESINNCSGAAQKMANIKLDNLQGDITLLNSAADGLKMTVGGMYENELRKLVQIGTTILTTINDLCAKNPTVVKAIMAVTAEVGVLVAGYSAYNAVKKIKNTLDTVSSALRVKNTAAAAAEAAATMAQAGATNSAAVAQTGLNAAMLANPIGIVLAAVGALTAAAVALNEIYETQEFDTRTLSTATEEQRANVENLTAEYNEACEKYGEADDKTRALKYDLDEATAAIDDQAFTARELYNEIDALHTSVANTIKTFDDSTTELDEQRESALILSAKLRELASSTDRSAMSQEKVEPIIERLNSIYPELGLTVENVSDKIDGLNQNIEKAARTNGWQERVNAAKEAYAQLTIEQAKLQEAADKAGIAEQKAALEMKKASEQAGKTSLMGGVGAFTGAYAQLFGYAKDAKDAFNEASEENEKAQQDLDAVNEKIEEAKRTLDEYGAIVTGTSDEAVSAYDAVSIAVSGVAEQTENLLTAYNEMYQAAYNSVSGQYALWDQAAEVSATSVDTVNANLEGQAKYWSDYNSNIETLLGKADKIDGLHDVIASFSDGSAESVNMITGMAAASDDDLKKMVENWKMVQDEQKKTAESLADTKLDFEQQMSEIQSTVADAVEKMNMEDSAKAAAQSTIQAYADAIMQGKTAVTDAAEYLKSALEGALNGSLVLQDFIIGEHLTHRQQKLDTGLNAYASGTNYAQSGYALVGEKGPELVKFGGGEQVYTANETRAVLGQHSPRYADGSGNTGSPITITISPNFTINGNADKDTLDYAVDKLVERVKDAIRDEQIDIRRGAYV